MMKIFLVFGLPAIIIIVLGLMTCWDDLKDD